MLFPWHWSLSRYRIIMYCYRKILIDLSLGNRLTQIYYTSDLFFSTPTRKSSLPHQKMISAGWAPSLFFLFRVVIKSSSAIFFLSTAFNFFIFSALFFSLVNDAVKDDNGGFALVMAVVLMTRAIWACCNTNPIWGWISAGGEKRRKWIKSGERHTFSLVFLPPPPKKGAICAVVI